MMGVLDISSVFNVEETPDNYKDIIASYRSRIIQLESAFSNIEVEIMQIKKEKEKIEKHSLSQEKKLTIEPKTGLPNRRKLAQDFSDLFDLDVYKFSGKHLAILIVQLDKSYNVALKTFPSTIADWVISRLGSKLKATAKSAMVYHTKENEFIIVLKDLDKVEAVTNYARKISNIIKTPENISGYRIKVGSNIGVAIFPEHGKTKEKLLTSADIALGYAQQRSLDFLFFEEKLRHLEVEKLELQSCMVKALEANVNTTMDQQFAMYYQPIITVGEDADGVLKITEISAEALVRWNHPTLGVISPGKFIPLSEETGIIVLLGNWIMFKVTDMIAYWKKEFNLEIPASINVSSRQFNEGNIVDFIIKAIKARSLSPGLLRVEVTETSLISATADILNKMLELRNAGIKISIDDFGTGYSSFNYLRQFAVDCLKIDKLFIDSILHNTFDQAIIRAIIAMSADINFDIVVEGVEDFNQFEFLYKEGCRKFQGYLFSKPLPPEQFVDFYKSNINKKIALQNAVV
ncbi:MAG: bifunctional diguanylate cyclase/phosphodiesterase [Spirochaetes bacterium]|nr:bifunctional diguanylate cyclase/phosphodiesterase [Spirochaetota bacterium]